jgi:outer membrane protein OmpA-like peptidoglycan-associated protein
MRVHGRLAFVVVASCLLLSATAVAQATDAEGSKDHPLFTRMPGYVIQRYSEEAFGTHKFIPGPGRDAIDVEGKYFEIRYSLKPGAKQPSQIEVLRNYENACKAIGGQVLVSNRDGSSFLKLVKNGRETWVEVSAYITDEWTLFIVEKGGMEQSVVANADALSSDIKAAGHVAIYGIYFDTAKAVVKPESDAAIAEIAKLLTANPSLAVHIVGHTDNVGPLDVNMKLSQARADAVVQVLVAKYGIATARLKASGVGPLSPVASNDSDEGKAKNRRVELVKQ